MGTKSRTCSSRASKGPVSTHQPLQTQYHHPSYPSLSATSFLGQAPTLITSNGQTIVESPVILTYLLKLYDTTDKYHPTSHQTSETVTSFTASSLGPITTTELIFELLAQQTPWPFSYIMNALRGKIQQAITRDGFRQGFVFLDKELGDQEWFNGTIPGQADFMAEFWVSMCVVRGWVDLEEMAPRLAKWRERVWQREAWKRGIERGGEYDLKMLGP
jgi:glutathione S-transferase